MVLLSCSGTGGGIYAKLANGMARYNWWRRACKRFRSECRASTTVFEPPSLGRVHPLAALRRLRQFDDLFFTLSRHRVKVRYKQSRLGLLWAVIQPLAMMLVFTLMFTFLRTAPSGQVPYPLFAYSALIPWTMFSSALTNACTALTSHAALLTKVYFPREILPLTYVVAALVDMAAASVVLAALMMWFGVPLTATAIWALPAIAVLTGLLVGLGLLLSALQVRYRDVGLAMPVLVQVWLFATPGALPALRREGRACRHPSTRSTSSIRWRASWTRFAARWCCISRPICRALAMSGARRRRSRAGSLRLLQVRRADDGGRRMSDATVDRRDRERLEAIPVEHEPERPDVLGLAGCEPQRAPRSVGGRDWPQRRRQEHACSNCSRASRRRRADAS